MHIFILSLLPTQTFCHHSASTSGEDDGRTYATCGCVEEEHAFGEVGVEGGSCGKSLVA